MNKLVFLVFATLFSYCGLLAQGQNINFNIANYENDTLIVGYYYGDRQLVRDTLFSSAKGQFSWKSDEQQEGGMYLLLFKPDNNILQFLMPEEDQVFDVKADVKDLSTAKITGSAENEAFFDYLAVLQQERKKAEPIQAKLKELEEQGKTDKALEKQLNDIDKAVTSKRDEVMAKVPGSVTYHLLRSNIEVDIPEFEGTDEEIQLKKFYFYRDHYFDNIDFSYPSMIRTPFFWERIDTYMEKLVPKAPDSIIQAVDFVLDKMKNNPDARKFALSTLLNKYAKNKYIGMDGIYVHMVDKYYSKGEADWVDEENLAKMKENANNLRPILIGKTFPNITVYKENEEPLMIHNVDADYTMVIFWAYDCGHCKKSMPKIVEFYEQYKDKGLKVVSICTKGGEKIAKCWEFIEEKGMEGFINAGDKYQKYRKYVYVPSTPKIFLLDKDKEILIKDVPSEELPKIMDEIMKDKSAE